MAYSPVITRPSGANRWVHCPGSASLEPQYPQEETEQTKEGTAAHWVAEMVLTGVVSDPVELVDRQAPNGVYIDPDMVDPVQMYVDYLVNTAHTTPTSVEQRVSIPTVREDHGGTPDVWFFDEAVLEVIDFKYGYAVVEPDDNYQLLDYAAGIIREKGIRPTTIKITIVQPRKSHDEGPIRSTYYTYDELWKYENDLTVSATEAHSENPRTITGKHCKDCSAMVPCNANKQAVEDAIHVIQIASIDNPDGDLISREIDMLRIAAHMVNNRLDALETLALAKIAKGEIVTDKSSKPSYTNYTFSKPANFMIALGKLSNVDISKDAVKTPNQSAKAGLPQWIVDHYKTRHLKEPKLITSTVQQRVKEMFNG